MKIQNMQQYKDGSLQTERIVFKENKETPNLIIDKSYQNGKVVDEWIIYYFNENGIVSRKVSIHNKAIVNECFYSYEFY
jgi:antitoxin component YwqK of YwqJK toxin-antitoxin module